tara:strand:- start:48 stop:923 length:876 start_codon:yes stop_codon:yes gene_type:complete
LKIIVTGSNGMLGSSLCRIFNKHHEVHAFHRDKKSFTSNAADYSIDLSKYDKLEKLFKPIEPDLVIHCAGFTDVDESEKYKKYATKLNVNVTENIAKLCSNSSTLIYISTDQVYGRLDKHYESEKILHPINQYGKTKLEAEFKVQELCSNHIIVRTNIFGWNAKPKKVSFAEWIYFSLRKNLEIKLFCDLHYSPIYNDELAKILIRLVDLNFFGVINIGSNIKCSKYDFGLQFAREFGLNESLISKGILANHNFFAPRPGDLTLNVEKLKSLGINIPSYKKSIKEMSKFKK